jgi:hypothetical protein
MSQVVFTFFRTRNRYNTAVETPFDRAVVTKLIVEQAVSTSFDWLIERAAPTLLCLISKL